MKKLVILFLGMLIITGCPKKMPPPDNYSQTETLNKISPTGPLTYSGDRMVAMVVEIDLKTTQPDTVRDGIIAVAFKYKGYVLTSENEMISIRIPAEEFGSAMADIEKMGKVVQKNIEGRDITDEYNDFQIRLDNAEKTRQRYLALLEKASGTQEILMLEKELERFSITIESLKGKIERVQHSVQYCTITVKTLPDISPARPGPVGYAFYYLYKGVKWLFVWD